MDVDTDRVMRGELRPGETLLWTGRPRQGIFLQPTDALLIPLSILWGGFAIFWEVMAAATGAPFFFLLFGVPFVLVGMYLILGRFWVDAQLRARTFYAVTSDRVIIVSGWFSRRVKSLTIGNLADATLSERRNGSGTISFAQGFPFAWMSGFSGWPGFGYDMLPRFELASGAREVYQTILSAIRDANQPR